MVELCGWAGLVLQVDLTSGKINKVPTAEYEPEKFIGGLGFNTKVFWSLGCPKIAAFDPENPLLVSVGPLTGVVGPCSLTLTSYFPTPRSEESGRRN